MPKLGVGARCLVACDMVKAPLMLVSQVWAAKQAVAAGTLSAQRFADAPVLPPDVDEELEEPVAEEVGGPGTVFVDLLTIGCFG